MRTRIGLTACALFVAQAQAAERIQIVATTTCLANIARSVAGDLAEVMSMTTGREDPHALTARPSFIVRARDADVWIRNGMDLELGWEPVVLRDSRNNRIREHAPGHIDASVHVRKLEVPTHRVTRDQGDVHPAGNPHYLMDPFNGRIVAATIAERLGALYPAHQETFADNLRVFERDLDTRMFGEALVQRLGGETLWRALIQGNLDPLLSAQGAANEMGGWYAALRPHRGKVFATYHRSLSYLADRFGLRPDIQLEPKPGIPPTARHLASVVADMQARQIRVIAQEPYYPIKAANLVASRTGATVLVMAFQTGGSPEAVCYLTMLDHVVTRLAGAL